MSAAAVAQQRAYYAETATDYDTLHLASLEHELALAQLSGYLSYYEFDSLLDVGSGTGRVLRHVEGISDSIKVMGIEPVAELRNVGHQQGIAEESLIDGDATSLPFADNSWDIVSAFGILHHIPDPDIAIAEMCRVARRGVFFSDLNNLGYGSLLQRSVARSLRALKLWKPFQWVKNGGKYDKYSEGDGIHYSYTLFDSLPTIRKKFPQTFLTNTQGNSDSLIGGCDHIAVFAVPSYDDLMECNPRI